MRKVLNLQPGDIFCSDNPQSFGLIVNYVQKFWSIDNSATFGHSGVILDSIGTTFEALWTIKRRNLYKSFLNKKILIGRNKKLNNELFWKGFKEIRKYEGNVYPLYRLSFFLFPPLAKYTRILDWGVCSELTAKFLMQCGLLDYWRGVMPDYIAEIIKKWKNWEIIYEGKL